jgi:hypothetical protein
MTKTDIAFAMLLLAGTTSASLATEFDSNRANRYPGYSASAPQTFQSAPVRLNQGRGVAPAEQSVPAPLHAGGVG